MKVLILLAAIALGQVSAYCPEFLYNQTVCSCSEYIDGAIIRCSGAESPHVVEKLKKYHPEIRELALENANILEIGARAFGTLRIKKLVLDNNRIKAINPQAFSGLENVLQELSINNNKLKEVPTESLEGLRALNILHLRCNEIASLGASAFVELPTLIEIDLSCNKISHVAADAFAQVRTTVQNINLDQNSLKQIPGKAVENMSELISLHMKYNKIEKLDKHDLQQMPNLAMLSLTGNKINKIDKAFVYNTTALKYVYLADNKIDKVDSETLKQFDTVEILDLSYNNIGDLAEKQFSVLESVQHLNLEGNHIKEIAAGAFAGTPLLLLWLPYNCLYNVSADVLKGIPFVKHISFAHNNLKNVESFSFAHLAQLHTLDLSYNLLDSVNPHSIQGADFLTTRLQENPFVCSQEGFHVMNGRDALNLIKEPNNVCKVAPKAQCPQKSNRPVPPPCGCTKKVKKTTTTAAPTTTTTTEAPVVAPTVDQRNLVAALAAVAQRQQQEQQERGSQQFDMERAAEAARRLNMARFNRLSKTPTEAVVGHETRPSSFLDRQRELLARTEQAQQQLLERSYKSKTSVSAPVEFSNDEQVEVVQREEAVPIAHVPRKL